MLYINNPCTDPYWNLAAEEYLLKNFTQPIFRLWRNESSIIIGHYQNSFAEIDVKFVKQNGIKVVRRLTGGGAVFHDLGNLNFTFIEERNPKEDTSVMFRRFTAPIIEALQNIGVKAYLEGRNDLLIEGKKFSGNALCIHKNRTLQHGTLLFSASMHNLGQALKSRPEKFVGKAVQSNRSRVTNIKEHIPQNLLLETSRITDIESFWSYLEKYICSRYPDIIPYSFTEKDLIEIQKLKEEKYSLQSWNFGTSPSYSFCKTAKFAGGIIELYLSVGKGVIQELQIMGDYFFILPTEEFCNKLIGVTHTPDTILETILGLDTDISSYFSNITAQEIASMFFE